MNKNPGVDPKQRTVGKRTCTCPSIWSILLVTLTSSTLLAQETQLTVQRIAEWPQLSGTAPTTVTWSPQSDRVAFLWNNEGMPFKDVWIARVGDAAPKRITDLRKDLDEAAVVSGNPVALPLAELRRAAATRADPGISNLAWTNDGSAILFSYGGGLYRTGSDGSDLTPLDGPKGSKVALQYSPDGLYLSFLNGGDLWLWKQGTPEPVRVSDIGHAPLGSIPGGAQGGADAAFSAYQWSPDSKYIALQYDDRRQVRSQMIPDFLTEEASVVNVRRERLGEGSEIRAIAIHSVDTNRHEFVALPDGPGRRISGFSWSPDGRYLLVDQNSEDAEHRWLYRTRIKDRAVEEIWHDHRATRPTRHWASAWHSDSQGVVFISDVDDRHHVYSLRFGEPKPRRLTSGDWSVVGENSSAVLTVAAATGMVYFIATEAGPEQRQVYAVPEAGGSVTRVSRLPGVHFPVVAPDGVHVAVLHSNDVTPTELYLIDSNGNEAERRVTHSPPPEFYEYEWRQPEYVTFPSRADGTLLHGRLMLPSVIDPGRKYPVILGPVYANSVRNRWLDRESQKGFYTTLQHYFAMEGYIGLQVDVAGSIGHGREFRERILTDFGGIDLEDLHSGVEYLKTLPYVDPDRIGIWGTSYGGLMTSLSLFTKPGVYAAGAACAPVTNMWHARPSVSGVMRHPEAHPDQYRQGSSILHAEGLQDHLLIVHGMVDDVVLFQDSAVLIEKLMLLGKDFDVAIAPSAVHDWEEKEYVAAHLLRKLVSHFDRHLRADGD